MKKHYVVCIYYVMLHSIYMFGSHSQPHLPWHTKLHIPEELAAFRSSEGMYVLQCCLYSASIVEAKYYNKNNSNLLSSLLFLQGSNKPLRVGYQKR